MTEEGRDEWQLVDMKSVKLPPDEIEKLRRLIGEPRRPALWKRVLVEVLVTFDIIEIALDAFYEVDRDPVLAIAGRRDES